MIESINCPKCSAPLPSDLKTGVAVCLYCNSSIRVQMDGTETTATLETSLDEKELAEVKRLLMTGSRSDAVERYKAFTGVADAEAAETVAGIARQLVYNTVRNQQLNIFGWLLVAAWLVLLVAAVIAGLSGQLSAILALVVIAFAAFNLYFFIPSIRTSLEFANAPSAPATTLMLAPIGVMPARNERIHTFRVLLEVQPENEAPFRAEMILPVREANLSRAVPGAVIHVKYLRNPVRLIFHKQKKSTPKEPSES